MKYTYLLALAGVALAASTGFSQTASVTITDPSFESGPVGQGSVPAGWTASGNGAIGAASTSYIVSDKGPNPTNVSGYDGSDEAELFSWNGGAGGGIGNVATALYQNLSTTFVAGDTYTLTALGANTTGQAAISGGYFFLTNSTAGYAPANVDITAPFTGTTSVMKTFTISNYTATAADNGLPIEIGFYGPAQPANATQLVAEFDDFALTVTTPTPEPSSIAIAALGGFGLLGLVRRRRA